MGNTISAANLGLQGMQKGMKGIQQNAQQIASSNVEKGAATQDVAQPLVEMKLNKLQVEASAKVVQASSDMIGTLLDIKA